jgi:hypothetical protein
MIAGGVACRRGAVMAGQLLTGVVQ